VKTRAATLVAPALGLSACSLVAGLGPEKSLAPDASAIADAAASDANADAGAAETGSGAVFAGCRIFPADNAWNRDVSEDPVDTDAMATIFPNMAAETGLHPDWGTIEQGYGIPINVGQAPPTPLKLTGPAASQSDIVACPNDAGGNCYGISVGARIEAASDAHLIVLDTTGAPGDCTLYEMVGAADDAGAWSASNGAVFHLGSNALRPDGWTSADPAGLPILAGLVRYDEARDGEIRHALRFTMRNVYLGYIHPATHSIGTRTQGLPPMGLRLRLKKTFDVSGFTGAALPVLRAMQKYGIILADRGSDWYVTGETSDGWASQTDDVAKQLGRVHGADFEIVKSGPVSTAGL